LFRVGNIEFDDMYLVLKQDDINMALNGQQKGTLRGLMKEISRYRATQGKNAFGTYLVINTDESYAGKVAEIMKSHGHFKQIHFDGKDGWVE